MKLHTFEELDKWIMEEVRIPLVTKPPWKVGLFVEINRGLDRPLRRSRFRIDLALRGEIERMEE